MIDAQDNRKLLSLGVLSVMVTLLLVASMVRFHNIEVQSLWHDEGISYQLSLRTLPEIAERAARDIHPPLYYWTLATWRVLTGESEFALRSLSAFFSILSIALTYALGRRLYGNVAGLSAAGFVALNTFSIYYAQETRMYAMLAAIAAGSMWLFAGFVLSLRYQRLAADKQVLALGLLNTVGLYTHYSYPLLMVVQGILFVLWLAVNVYELTKQQRANIRDAIRRVVPLFWRYVLANIITIVLFAPLILNGWFQVTSQPNISEAISMELMLRELQGWFAFGNTFEQSVGGMGVAMYFFLLFGLLILPAQVKKSYPRWRMLLPVVWVGVSAGVFLTLELYLRYMRFLLPVQIGFAVWMGRGVWVLWTVQTRDQSSSIKYLPKFAAAFGAFGLLINMSNGLAPLYDDSQFQRDDYRGMAQSIMDVYRPGDVVILDAPNQAEVFSYYYHGQAQVFSMPASSDDAQTLADTRQIIVDYDRIFVLFWGMAERDPNGVVEGTLNREAFQASDVWYGDVRFVRYVTPVEFSDIQRSGAKFGEAIILQQYALNAEVLQPGDVLQVRLDWTTETQLSVRYKVFVQLLKPDGTLAVQRDSEPGGGQALTTLWSPGETVLDNHALVLPVNLPPAQYTLIVGLYDLNDSTARLPVDEGDALTLATIEIVSN